MATDKEHLARAASNEEFLSNIRAFANHADWGITVVFYIAVHWGRAFLARSGIQITSHKHFQSEFVRITHDNTTYGHFRFLQTASEQARYDVNPFTWNEVDNLIKAHLGPLKEGLRKHGLKP
jgi:hypothetical protein